MKRIFFKILIVILVIISGVISYLVFDYITASRETKALRAAEKAREELVDNLIQQRRLNTETSEADPFGPDDIVNVLLIGLDSRLGQTNGHCDAIQLISINRKTVSHDPSKAGQRAVFHNARRRRSVRGRECEGVGAASQVSPSPSQKKL